MATALVIAGNSFIGRHLCGALREAGLDVVATARDTGWLPGAEPCDLTDRDRVDEVVAAAQPQWVFQCAGATATDDPVLLYRLHVGGTLHLLAAVARHAPAAPVALLGSAAEYGVVGPEALPVTEAYPAAPRSFFGASKLAQTQAGQAAAAEWGLSVAAVRPFNVLGPGLPAHYFAASFAQRLVRAKAAGAGGDVPVVNADATRDFVDVRDVAQALVGLMARAVPPAGTMALYNIASGRETPLRAVARKLCDLAGGFRAVDAGAGRSRSNISRSCGDAGRLRQATGWVPRIGWEQSVEDLWQSQALPEHAGAAPEPSGDETRRREPAAVRPGG
jgi:nucleoside-diphosphate-sugar epimerase